MKANSDMKVRLTKEQKIKIANSDNVYTIMQAVLMRQNKLHRLREYFWVMGLNNANDILYLELVALGRLNAVNVDPVEIFSFAAQKKCTRIILIHNHTSSLKPSKEDIKLTATLAIGAHFLKMQILDHLIINETDYETIGDYANIEGLMQMVGIKVKPDGNKYEPLSFTDEELESVSRKPAKKGKKRG